MNIMLTKIKGIKDKIPHLTTLATNTTVENEISDCSKYVTTLELSTELNIRRFCCKISTTKFSMQK